MVGEIFSGVTRGETINTKSGAWILLPLLRRVQTLWGRVIRKGLNVARGYILQ